MGLETTGVAGGAASKTAGAPELAIFLQALSAGVVTGTMVLIQVFIDTLFSQRDPLREEFILSLFVILSLKSPRICVSHTFPLLSLLGARRSGIGIGGSDLASVIASPDVGV